MSHFTLAVATKDMKDLERVMEPYWEELQVEQYIDKTREQIIEEGKRIKERVIEKANSGKKLDSWDLDYYNAQTDEDFYDLLTYEDEEYDEEGNHLSTYNPNSKWDWYSVGGRWNKLLLTKEENTDTIDEGEWGLFRHDSDRETPEGYKWVNGCQIKKIDFEKMKELSKQDFFTWALLDEDEWYEQGQMGWWSTNDATEDSIEDFKRFFTEYMVKEENQDKYLIIVDCHI